MFYLMAAPKCHGWNLSFSKSQTHHDLRSQERNTEKQNTGMSSRRRMCYESIATASFAMASLFPRKTNAYIDSENKGIVTVQIESSRDSLGVEILDTTINGKSIIAIDRIVVANKNNMLLREGMILKDNPSSFSSSKELVNKLKRGPYPIELNFYNLGSGGDAIGDLGSSIVKPKDALELAQSMDNTESKNEVNGGYKVTTIRRLKPEQQCAIKSKRNDIVEIEYEAYYVDNKEFDRILYDASSFRGTSNNSYQMVLGSGDMIPGVDLGLYDMCPGETRLLEIPPLLGHGPRSLKLFRIPSDYIKLVWRINLISIDSTIRGDNNDISREERESRFSY